MLKLKPWTTVWKFFVYKTNRIDKKQPITAVTIRNNREEANWYRKTPDWENSEGISLTMGTRRDWTLAFQMLEEDTVRSIQQWMIRCVRQVGLLSTAGVDYWEDLLLVRNCYFVQKCAMTMQLITVESSIVFWFKSLVSRLVHGYQTCLRTRISIR